MSGRKSRGSARISGASKVQKVEKFCKSCDALTEFRHVLIVSAKKSWKWRCNDCGSNM